MRLALPLALGLLALLLQPRILRAQEAGRDLAMSLAPAPQKSKPQPADAADAQVIEKTGRVLAALEAGAEDGKRWQASWLVIFGAGALGSSVLASTTEGRDAAVWRIGTLRASLGVASVLFVPFPASGGERGGSMLPPLRRVTPLEELPDSTPEERRAKLAAAEHRLRLAANFERFGRSWFPHAAGITVSLSFAAWLWIGYHRPGAAALSLATGLAASEAKIWTMPTRAIADEDAILGPADPSLATLSPDREPLGSQPNKVGSYPNHFASKPSEPRFTWAVSPAPAGLVFAGSF